MKKVLISCLFFLSACVSDSTAYKYYDVPNAEKKARLFIAKPNAYPDQWAAKLKGSPVVQKELRKHFVASDEKSADFVLTQNHYKDNTSSGSLTWAFFSGLTLGVLPYFGETHLSFSYTLKKTDNGRLIYLSDVDVSARGYFGWLLIPAAVFPGVSVGGNFDDRAMASAIREAATLVYDKNSKLYQKVEQRNWGLPSAGGPEGKNARPSNASDMDAAW